MASLDALHEGTEGMVSDILPEPRKSSASIFQEKGLETPPLIPLSQGNSPTHTNDDQCEAFDSVDHGADRDSLANSPIHAPWNTLENISAVGLSFNLNNSPQKYPSPRQHVSLDDYESHIVVSSQVPHHRFHKWITNLQRRAVRRRNTMHGGQDCVAPVGDLLDPDKALGISGHKKSLSGSSLGFVTAVKSASVSLASFGVAPRSRRTGRSSRYQRTDKGSRASNTGIRLSEDSSCFAKGAIMDEAVNARSMQRRQVLEEIIRTEEGYVADIKFLMNVYGTLLASIPTISPNLRKSITQNLNEIIELHEEILGELHRVVPHSEYSQVDYTQSSVVVVDRENRPSTNAIGDISWMHKIPGMTAEALTAAEVARIFGQKMHRFFVYEEYGAKYEMMVKDVASTHRTIPQWEAYQQGLEALASSLSPINSKEEHSKKSLTVGDLLVKPIQRVCRYPLMFAELLKRTPVCDCPDSYAEIEKVLSRLREMTAEINRATDDPRMKMTMEKTWILQDRLLLSDQVDKHSKITIRTLGRIHLCGALHVTWQTKDGVDGQHMISLLYRDCLVLASAEKAAQIYVVQTIIGLSGVRVEEVDNGRGLQCHTSPFSWKLVFECDHQLYEIILSACTPKEELEWRTRLTEKFYKDHNGVFENPLFTSLSLEIKPLGTIFGKPGTIARRISIHRATTVGPKSSLCQVLIKNTTALKEIAQSASSTSINRSQSLLTTNRIPVLAPTRAERVRLEHLLSDVWTREILPFPGMTGRTRSEHLVRASASSMIRKLSVASIAGNFTKRSASYVSLASIHQPAGDKQDIDGTNCTSIGRWESILQEKNSIVESDDTAVSRLLVIKDENPPFDDKISPLTGKVNDSSPVGSLKSLAPLRGKKSWQPNGSRIVTPPLRNSSANSANQIRTTSASKSPFDGDENKQQQKHGLWAKAAGMNRSNYADGIRGFFR